MQGRQDNDLFARPSRRSGAYFSVLAKLCEAFGHHGAIHTVFQVLLGSKLHAAAAGVLWPDLLHSDTAPAAGTLKQVACRTNLAQRQ